MKLTLKKVTNYLEKYDPDSGSFGVYIDRQLDRGTTIDGRCWCSLFVWASTSIYIQIETLKLAGIL